MTREKLIEFLQKEYEQEFLLMDLSHITEGFLEHLLELFANEADPGPRKETT